MPYHPAIAPGRAAVITGAASGIGLAAAYRFVAMGMKVCLADINAEALKDATSGLAAIAQNPADVISQPTDVSRREEVQRLRGRAYEAFGEVAILMNNAGREGGGQLLGDAEHWRQIIETNLWGVVHGIQLFALAMIAQGTDGAIISTGSKQGITTPPGDTAYNVSKAGVKVATEALAHDLRNTPDCKVTAHLLVPGFTFTGFTKGRGVTQKPQAAWTPEQVVDFMLDAMGRGDFYILCPDNDVTSEVDAKRIRWAAEDIVQNRPPLSRWHPDFKQAFEDYMKG